MDPSDTVRPVASSDGDPILDTSHFIKDSSISLQLDPAKFPPTCRLNALMTIFANQDTGSIVEGMS
jgi:hypothetical protein